MMRRPVLEQPRVVLTGGVLTSGGRVAVAPAEVGVVRCALGRDHARRGLGPVGRAAHTPADTHAARLEQNTPRTIGAGGVLEAAEPLRRNFSQIAETCWAWGPFWP
jgi:hypothetical protein